MTTAAYSNVGRRPGINQDNYCILEKTKNNRKMVLAVLCDGLGGLARGELASKTVILSFQKWFHEQAGLFMEDWNEQNIQNSWDELLEQCNRKIYQFGFANNLSIGTTVSAVILFAGRFLIMHIGDCRIYELGDSCKQLTRDQVLSKERCSVLLQCVGAGRLLKPQVVCGNCGRAYFICSDGFYHLVSGEEICRSLANGTLSGSRHCQRMLEQMGWNAMQRGENDNLSAIYIRVGR